MQSEALENKPLSSNDQAKLMIFTLLLAPTILFLVGIVPAIFLAFGIFMMKKNQDFTHIDVAYKNFRRLTLLVAVVGLVWSLGWVAKESNNYIYSRSSEW